ncbi:uncharacterized protein A4U43_C06F4760 [Asparagus officinalis]|uniref:Cation efflux protein cytoplasmic domain-containing protein n=1 Tax=Asparagus officinalis TaxID=4686 RepID=A0A5P1ENM4_ASPOF|nr:uncharacterized protein A4U43_C06F4760 [Asparagus officinalis]
MEEALLGRRSENWSPAPGRLRGDFVSRLPEKVRPGLDPENPSQIDVSRTTGLLRGEKDYYERQFATLRAFEEVDTLIASNKNDEDHEGEENLTQAESEFAIKISNYANICLLVLKVDIELPEDLPLKQAHTIGETLQIKIEGLPEVERAFVHLDFECEHKPEHSVLSKLPES